MRSTRLFIHTLLTALISMLGLTGCRTQKVASSPSSDTDGSSSDEAPAIMVKYGVPNMVRLMYGVPPATLEVPDSDTLVSTEKAPIQSDTIVRTSSDNVIRVKYGVPSAQISITTAPLYIVDGKTLYTPEEQKIIEQLNPHDIESIQILKPEEAVLQYGSRGENGVILVTTKKAARRSRKKN